MQIAVVTPMGDKLVVYVSPTSTIRDVKEKVEEETGIPRHQQQIGFHGKILDEGASLAAIGVADGHTLEMTWALTTSSTSPIVATTSTTPSESFLAPKADENPSVYIALAVILPLISIGIYAWRVQRLKAGRALTKVTPIHIVTEPPLKLWDGDKSPFPRKGFSFKSSKSRASLATTPDYKNDSFVDDMDSSVGSKSLPHLLGNSTIPQHKAAKKILTGPEAGFAQDTPGAQTNRNLNSWQIAHCKHFPSSHVQKEDKLRAAVKIVVPEKPPRLDAEVFLRPVAQQSSASPSTSEVNLYDLELRHAARQTCAPLVPEVLEVAGRGCLAATSAVQALAPSLTKMGPPRVLE